MASSPADVPNDRDVTNKIYPETNAPGDVSLEERDQENRDAVENSPNILTSSTRSKRVTLVSIYTVLILGLDYLPRPPNVEFMTCLLVVAGYCFGARVGGPYWSRRFCYLFIGKPAWTIATFIVRISNCFLHKCRGDGEYICAGRQYRPFKVGGVGHSH